MSANAETLLLKVSQGCEGQKAIFQMQIPDKFHDECGVVAIFAHPEAETLAYLGLHALQHRGQESAGIVTSDGMVSRAHKAMGSVAEIFTEETLSKMRGTIAIGHTRYSTAGDSALLNAQPILVQSNKGSIGVAHNGNLVNATQLRARLESQGSIFQTNSDTEVIVHLIALSKEQTLPEAMADALRRVEGAFSLVMMSNDRIFAVRDPRGFRPLAMGRIPALEGQKHDTIVFASETCAFDLIGADYVRDVKPGELIVVGPEGVSSRFYSTAAPQSSCIFEHVYFSRPDSLVFGRPVQTSREELGRQLAREAGVEADLVVPVPDSGVTAAVGYSAESGIPVPLCADPKSLCWTNIYRAKPERSRLWGEAEAQSRAFVASGQARRTDRRFDSTGHYQPEDCPHDPQCRSERGSHANLMPANDFSLLLRRGYALEEISSSLPTNPSMRSATTLAQTRSLIFRSKD